MRSVTLKVLTLTFFLILICGANQALAESPTEAVKGTVDEVIRILTQKQRRFQLVKQTVDRRFDYEEMAGRSLPNWNKLSAAQRREFVGLFSELLEASYADKLMKYSGEKVAYRGERLDGDRAEVSTVLLRRNDRIPINYRLLNKSRWVIYDVVIEGVSLVNNYRSQFTRVISESSYQDLVRRLQTKVDELHRMGRR
jgi:phospholipid transport system substrate-binding protein